MSDPDKTSILLIEPSLSEAGFVHHMLTRAGYDVAQTDSGKQGLILIWRDQPAAVVLELSLPDIDGLEVIRKLRADKRTARLPIICLTGRTLPEDAIQAHEAGADYFIVKQADALDLLLRNLASALIPQGARSESTAPIHLAPVLAFMGAQGGVGTSSLCLNIANRLAELSLRRPIAVIDFALPPGSLSAITACERPLGLLDLCELPAPELTPDYLRKNLPAPTSWGFRLVKGFQDPAQAAHMHQERLMPVFQSLRSAFNMLCVDLGRNLSDSARFVLSQADRVAFVVTPNPTSAPLVPPMLAYLEQQGITQDKLFLISNRPLPAEGLSGDALETILGHPISGSIVNVSANFSLANALHSPYKLRFPDDSASDSLRQIGETLHQAMSSVTAAD
jgi:CheY-like chemotaxis protein/MinD-like ATPase involved in chromosome partitioning or flagellar assembly